MSVTRDGKMWRCQFYYKDWQGVSSFSKIAVTVAISSVSCIITPLQVSLATRLFVRQWNQ